VIQERFGNKGFAGIATLHPFGGAKSIVFREARSRLEITANQVRAGCLQSEHPSYLTGDYFVMERHENGGLLPTQQIHPFLGSAMT
jgi:hypothetical protein